MSQVICNVIVATHIIFYTRVLNNCRGKIKYMHNLLKCLSAQAVRRHGLSFRGKVSATLEKFIILQGLLDRD